jgi:hypothetical protein
MTISLHNLGRVLIGQGQFGEAAGFLAESIEISLELGYRELLGNCLQAFAELSASCGEPERAARLLGAAESVLEELGVALGTEERQGYERTLQALESELGADALRALRAEGASLPLGEAVVLALRG